MSKTNDTIAAQAARKIVAYIALPDSAEPDDSTGNPVEYVESLISAEYKPLLRALREALRYGTHAAFCMTINKRGGVCNCWVSQAQKILGEQ